MWAVSFLEIRLKVSLQKLSLQFWAFAMNLWGFLLFYEDESDSSIRTLSLNEKHLTSDFVLPCMTWNIRDLLWVTFHQTNQLHDRWEPLNLHFTNQINILSKTSGEKNIFNTQANQLLQAKWQAAFPHYSTVAPLFLKVSCWDGNWTFSHGRVSGFVFLFFPDLNYTERRFESRFEELPCSLFPGSR